MYVFYFVCVCDRVAEPETAFLAGAGAEKITKFRLRLLGNWKAENYEFCIFVSGKKINFLKLFWIHSFLPYNSPGAGAGSGSSIKGRLRLRNTAESNTNLGQHNTEEPTDRHSF